MDATSVNAQGWQRRLQSPWLHVAALSALAFLVCLVIDPTREPIFRDRAYFVYLGQAVARGIPIYSRTFFGYPPLAPLLAAGAIQVGGWFGVATWLAPRFAGILVYVGCVALAYVVVRHATRSAWAGGFAGITMASFSHFTTFSVANLDPKNLVVLATWAVAASVQRRNALAAGLASGLCAMCWQPSGVIALAAFVVLLTEADRSQRRATLLRFALGVALGLLPAILYLSLSGSWHAFWLRAIAMPATLQLHPWSRPGWWLTVTASFWHNEIPFFLAAAVGFGLFAVASAFRGPRRMARAWLDSNMGAMPLWMPAWIVFNSMDFQGADDLLPALPAVTFWAAWAIHRLLSRLRGFPKLAPAAAASLLLAAAVIGLGDALLYEPGTTLDEERAVVNEIVGLIEPGALVVAFEAPEFYVLSERSSPLPLLSLNAMFVRAAEVAHPQGCAGIRRDTLALRPGAVVVLDHPWQSECVRELTRQLVRRRYARWDFELAWNRHRSYVPNDSAAEVIHWQVYVAPPRS